LIDDRLEPSAGRFEAGDIRNLGQDYAVGVSVVVEANGFKIGRQRPMEEHG